jgi:hypothetical protein
LWQHPASQRGCGHFDLRLEQLGEPADVGEMDLPVGLLSFSSGFRALLPAVFYM